MPLAAVARHRAQLCEQDVCQGPSLVRRPAHTLGRLQWPERSDMSVTVTAVYLDAAGLRCGRADEVRALVDEPRRADCMVRTLAAPPRSWPT